MIYQLPIDLDIENKTVQAIIDLDTGFIGFNELKGNECVEFNYVESPVEFRKAFIERMMPFIANNKSVNFKVSRKDEKMKRICELLRDVK